MASIFLKALLSGHARRDQENPPNNNQQAQAETNDNNDFNNDSSNIAVADSTTTNINSNTTVRRSDAHDSATNLTSTNSTTQKVNYKNEQPEQNTKNTSHQHIPKTNENKSASQPFKNMDSTTLENRSILITNNNNNNNNNTIIKLAAKNKIISTSSNIIDPSSSNLKKVNDKMYIQQDNTLSKQVSNIKNITQNTSPPIVSKTSIITPNSSNNTKTHDDINAVTENKSKKTYINNATTNINSRLSLKKRDVAENFTNNINSRLSYPLSSTNTKDTVVKDDENSKRLYINRLDENVTKEDLFDCFKCYGPITEVYKKPNVCFGFVQYLEPKYAERAISYEDDRFRWGSYIGVQKCQHKRTYVPSESTTDCMSIPEIQYYDYDSEENESKSDTNLTKNSSSNNATKGTDVFSNDKERSSKSNRYDGRDDRYYSSSNRHKDNDYYRDKYSYDERNRNDAYDRYNDYYYSRKQGRSRERSNSSERYRSRRRSDSSEQRRNHRSTERHRSRERGSPEDCYSIKDHQKTTSSDSSSLLSQDLKGNSSPPKNYQNVSSSDKTIKNTKQALKFGLKRAPTDNDIMEDKISKFKKTDSLKENNNSELESDIIKMEETTNNSVEEHTKKFNNNYFMNSYESNTNNNINSSDKNKNNNINNQPLNQSKQYAIKENINNTNNLVTLQNSLLNDVGSTTVPSSTATTTTLLNFKQENNNSMQQSIIQKSSHMNNDPRLRNNNIILNADNSSPIQSSSAISNISTHNIDPRLSNRSPLNELLLALSPPTQLQHNNPHSYSTPSNLNRDPRFTMKLTQHNMNESNKVNLISPIMSTSISSIQNANTESGAVIDNSTILIAPPKIPEPYVVQLVCIGSINQKLYIDIENQLSSMPKIKCRILFFPYTNLTRDNILKQIPIIDVKAVMYMDESYQVNNKVFLQIFNNQVTERVHFDEYEEISIFDAILIIQRSIENESSNLFPAQLTHIPNNPSMASWPSMELASNLRTSPSSSTQTAKLPSNYNDPDRNLQTIQYIISNLKHIQDYTAKNNLSTLTSYNALASNPDYINLVSQALIRLNTNVNLNPTIRYQVIQELLACLLSSPTKQEHSFHQSFQPNYESTVIPLLSSLGNSPSLTLEQRNAVQSLINSFTTDSSKQN